MANLVRIGIALIVVLVILVDSKSLKSSKPKVAGGKAASSNTIVHKPTAPKATGTKAIANKTPAKKTSVKKTSVIKTTAQKASISQASTTQKPPVTEAPIQPQNVAAPAFDPSIFATLLTNPQLTGILTKLKSGGNLTAADMIPLMLVGLQAGLQTTNPALNSLSLTVNETVQAVSASKDGKLSTGKMMIYSNKILIALGNATETPKENMSKLKACMANGMRSYTSMEPQIVFWLLTNCSMYLGNGTKDGDAGVLILLTAFLPPGVRDVVQNPVALGTVSMVNGIVSQALVDTAGKEGTAAALAAAPALIGSLDAMVKDAGLNLNFGQIFAGFGFGR